MDNDKQSINASPGLIALRSLRLPLLLAAIAIVGLTAAAITYDIARHRTEQTIGLQAIADLKAGQIDDWLRERQGGANYLHTDLTLTENYRRWRQHGDRTSREHLIDHLERFRVGMSYPQLASHVKEHAAFVDKMAAFNMAASASIPDRAAIHDYLKEWLLSHILNSDMLYRHFVEKGRHARQLELPH